MSACRLLKLIIMKKQNIKKALVYLFKVIVIAFACIGAFFSGFLIVSTILSKQEKNTQNNENSILEVVATTPVVHNAFVVNGYEMYIGFSEFGSFPYYRSFIQNLENFDYIYTTNITPAQFKAGTPIDVSVNFHMGNMANGVFDWQWSINHLRIELDTSRSQEDRIIWKFTETGGGTFNLEARYVYYDSLKLDCIMNEVRVINGNTTTGWLNLCFTYNIFNYRSLLPTSYSDMDANVSYREGYETGYSAGVSDGYNGGYNAGYNAGVQSATQGDPYNIFSLLKSSFDSVASILNIQLFPGISLGLLLFTPLVVVIVIALVKMFKG